MSDLFASLGRPIPNHGPKRFVLGLLYAVICAVLFGAYETVQVMATVELPPPYRTMIEVIVVAPKALPEPSVPKSRPKHKERNNGPVLDPPPNLPPPDDGDRIPPGPPGPQDDKGGKGDDSGLPPGPRIDTTPPSPPPDLPVPQTPIRPHGGIRAPERTHYVRPVYPMIAQAARIQGVVIIEAVLAPDGRVRDARIMRGVSMLDQAALDAVLQWQYTPTLLNGQPVPVIMTVTVQFTLQ